MCIIFFVSSEVLILRRSVRAAKQEADGRYRVRAALCYMCSMYYHTHCQFSDEASPQTSNLKESLSYQGLPSLLDPNTLLEYRLDRGIED